MSAPAYRSSLTYRDSGTAYRSNNALPSVLVECSFFTEPDDTPLWTDISSRVRGYSTRRGRQFELDRFEAGTATVVLDNRDRALDPNYAGSPYASGLLPMRRFRIRSQWGHTYPIFDGYIDGWPQTYVQNKDATVTVTATDAFKVTALKKLPNSVYEYEVSQDSPVHWWRLGDKQGQTLLDSGSTPVAGALSGAANYSVTGSSPFDSDTAIEFVDPSATGGGVADFGDTVALSTSAWSIELWVRAPLGNGDLLIQQLGDAGPDIWAIRQTSATAQPDKLFFFIYNHAGTVLAQIGPTSVDALQVSGWHHIVVTADGSDVTLYMDGVSIGTDAYASIPPAGTVKAACPFNYSFDAGVVVGMDEIAFYTSALSVDRILAHYQAATQAWSGETSDARITRALAAAGFPSDTNLDAGLATMGAAVLGTQTVKDHIEEVELAEGGDFFFAADGTATFFNRHHLVTDPAVRVLATFSD